jgi:hypothetical protein
MRAARRAPAAGLLGVVLLAASAVGEARAAPATLENDSMRLTLTDQGGARLVSWVAKRQGRELLRQGAKIPLYQVELRAAGGASTIDALQADETHLATPAAGTIVLTSVHRRAGIEVTCTIRLRQGGEAAEFSAEVKRAASAAAVGILRYPAYPLPLSGGKGSARILLPVGDGEILADAASALADGETRGFNYPGIASAQMMALFDDQGGAVTWAADGAGNFKRLAARRVGSDALLYFEHVLLHLKGERIVLPYAVRLAPFEGGWERAADVYKAWATKQSWCARRLEERTPPAALRAPSFFLGLNVREARGVAESVDRGPEIAAVAAGWSAGLGMPVTAILLGWENHGPWIAPDYFPPYGGDAGFRSLIGGLHEAGNHALLFLSGLNVTLEKTARNGAPAYTMPQADALLLRPSAVVDPDGQVRVEGTAAAEGIGAHLVLCPATDAARAALDDAFDRLSALGADVVQIDQIPGGGTPPCFATGHGHPPGGGTTAYTALAAILDGLGRRGGGATPRPAVSLEEPGELFIPHVDLFHCREYMQGLWPRDGRGVVGVPLFSYLYHEYALGYGGDSAPIATTPADLPPALYAQAMNLYAGRLPGAAVWMRMIPFASVREEQRDFMTKAAALLRGPEARQLLGGRIVDLGVDPGSQIVRGTLQGSTFQFPAPQLMARGFELADGARAVLYLNATDTRRPVRVELGPDAAAGSVASGRAPGTRVTRGAQSDMGPREIVLLQVDKR